MSVPNSDYKEEGVGEELRMNRQEWEGLLARYKLLESKNYGRALLKLFRNKPGQYLARIVKPHQ